MRATRSCARSPPPTPPPRPPSPTTSTSWSRPPCACAAPTASPSSSTSRTPSSSTAAAACAASSSATSAASASTAPASPPPATTRPSPPAFIVTDDLAELQTKLAHTLLHAHLAAVFTWAAELLGADERALWAHTRATIDAALTAWAAAQPRLADACAADRSALLAPEVQAKALLRMRIDERVSDYGYTRVPSPLAAD
ncbi:MAG: ferric iron reductase [Nannocystis sp.]|nr:ferric iron reductase [Nannocystis sp.]MBK7825296.1 ferric iron reductase [Nannocystis sp.]